MDRVEKTVFISYRRTNVPWALAINQYLMHSGYDVFFDFQSIASGDFEQIITENIKARAHFLILLTPSALERCNDPEDMFKREIEIALDCKRNIIPVILEGFDFDAKETIDYLKGDLEKVKKYNGLRLYAEYFDAGMKRLCEQFLDIPLDRVKHPELPKVSSKTQQVVEEQKRVVAEQLPVEKGILSAQEWFEKAFKATKLEDQIRLYSTAIDLDQYNAYAYNNRGLSYIKQRQYRKAINDFNQAIELDPFYANAYSNRAGCYYYLHQYEKAIGDNNRAITINPKLDKAYSNRGLCYANQEQYKKAIDDYNQAVKLNPELMETYYNRGLSYASLGQYKKAINDFTRTIKSNTENSKAYYNRGLSYAKNEQYEKAINDFTRSIKLNPRFSDAYYNRGLCNVYLMRYEKAIADCDQAIKLKPEHASAYYNKACTYALRGKVKDVLINLRQALKIDPQQYCDLTRNDSDFNQIRENIDFRNLLKEFCDQC